MPAATEIVRTATVTAGWEDLGCAGECGKGFVIGDKVTRVEQPGFYVRQNRYKQYHWYCWPPRLEREFNRIVRKHG
jgi:hypothetical protein